MNISFLPVQFVIYDLIHVRMGKLNIVRVGIDEVAELESVTDVHEQASLTITSSKRHLRV